MSWVRAPIGTSQRMRNCMGSDKSPARFKRCAGLIVESDGGKVVETWFEANGKYAHIHVSYDDVSQLNKILYDLDAVETSELLETEEADEFVRERRAAADEQQLLE
jgi:hypothetical protein